MRSLFGGSGQGHLDVDLLSAFLDRETTSTERTRVETHLQTCSVCSAELESLRRTVVLLHGLPRVPVPRAFTLSEAQVGIRRPAANAGWYGGLLRGLGAVAAIALVAFVTVSLLQQPAWQPGGAIARAPTLAAPAPTEAPAAPAPGLAQDAAAEPTGNAAELATQPAVAAEAIAEPSPEPQPAAEIIAAAPAPSPDDGARSAAATAPPAAPVEPPMAALAAKAADTPAAGALGFGRGGGAGGGEDGLATPDLPPELLTPEPVPPALPLAEALSSDVRLVYADLKALYAVDSVEGVRQLVAMEGINSPQLSPDQAWIVYRIFAEAGLQVWGIPWDGGESRLLLQDGELTQEGLPDGYIERHLSDTRWVPGGHTLVVTVIALAEPDSTSLPPITELWHLDVQTGEFKLIAMLDPMLDRAYRPYYSPDGKRFATLQYGTEAAPDAALMVYQPDGEGGFGGQRVLTFTASRAKPTFDSQIIWVANDRLMVAIPDADPWQSPTSLNGTTLYSVAGSDPARQFGHVDGFHVAWSPDGTKMVYSRYTSDALDSVELYVASAEGSSPQLYAQTKFGVFMSWSPDSSHFLYTDNYTVYAGTPGRPALRLANGVSLVDPRWLNGREFISQLDQGDNGWWLTRRSVDGGAAGLMPLPRDAMIDAVTR